MPNPIRGYLGTVPVAVRAALAMPQPGDKLHPNRTGYMAMWLSIDPAIITGQHSHIAKP